MFLKLFILFKNIIQIVYYKIKLSIATYLFLIFFLRFYLMNIDLITYIDFNIDHSIFL